MELAPPEVSHELKECSGRVFVIGVMELAPPEVSHELKECSGRVFVIGVMELAPPEMLMVDLSQVDVILISNSASMLALPFITQYTGFRGEIFCTDPTLQIGKLYMRELVTYIERVPRTKSCSRWKKADILKNLPLPLREAVNPTSWRKCYTLQDIDACMSRVQVMGFNEKKSVFGSLTVTCCSSGYSLGSCNWIIHSEYEKICYISATSTLTTHPKPIDQAPLRNSNVVILSSLTQTPLTNPDSMIGEFCVNAAVTIKNGGNVLVPCYPSGVTYDLFECLSGHLDSCGLSTVPLYFISPISDSTLAYSNIFAEWLSTSKQSKVYLPEPPFPHAELLSLGRLKQFTNIHDVQNDFKCPCVVFTGHPSLRIGDVIHFIELWGKSSANTIIFTEPDFPYLDALGPFQPLQMRVCYCPIDTSLSFSQANKLLKDIRPQHLVVPESYLTPPTSVTQRPDLVINADLSPMSYKQGDVITLPVKRKFECIEIDPKLAATLEPIEVKPGSAITMVNATLVVRDNKYVLQPLNPEDKLAKPFKPRTYIYGTINCKTFVDLLAKQGISDVKLEETEEKAIIELPNDDILIQVENGSTHIMCGGDESVRVKIRDALLQCLQKL
ncbi:integrator complex subunit 9-like isoform X5 [Dreissena polymorpha]|nr:integrator complex subunit 9-like isoform X3 [Dreissena polymorpha]XP_052237574.1 integrator complex subunit 9-like isoform X4 [Dreissena polymorpha]XP_052237575.1 integrator complex subunit 9-like isoform X5 [Dreissena polymorpha]